MSYGTLIAICGPMYSAKTKTLLQKILWARSGEERDVLVLKPIFDDRYSEKRIVTHDGLSVSALPIKSWNDAIKKADFADIVFFDEIQFFDKDHFDGEVQTIVCDLLRRGKNVVVSGLDLDSEGHPFPIMAHFLAMADEIIKLRSFCAICGKQATKTQKLISNDKLIELGSVGMYEPRCNDHWTHDPTRLDSRE